MEEEEDDEEEEREEVLMVELHRGPHGLGLALVDGTVRRPDINRPPPTQCSLLCYSALSGLQRSALVWIVSDQQQ